MSYSKPSNRNSLKRNQQQKLKNLLEAAVNRNKKLEDDYANQVISLQKEYDLKLDAASGTSKAELEQAKRCSNMTSVWIVQNSYETYYKSYKFLIALSREQKRMAKTIKELEEKLAIAKADDEDDDAMIEELEGTVFQLKSKISQK